MAFHQPTFAPSARPMSAPGPEPKAESPSFQNHSLEDSREWVLFPSRHSAASYTQATSTERTPRTAGLSRLSDFGSLNSGAQSGEREVDGAGGALDASLNEEDEGLDSLDEGLHAFQEPSKLLSEHFHPSGNSILPRHDGLGGFPTSLLGLEEHGSWLPDRDGAISRKRGFEVQRRRTSMNMERGMQEALMEDDQSLLGEERRERIEKWRLEHSRVLLSEIEKETRRRRVSFRSQKSFVTDGEQSRIDLEGFGHIIRDELDGRSIDQLDPSTATNDPDTIADRDTETFWERITFRIIRDFVGINDDMLAVILGESLVEEELESGSPPHKAPRLDDSRGSANIAGDLTWEKRLIDRVARELGIVFDQTSDRPSTIASQRILNPSILDYAGLPVTQPTSSRTHRPRPTVRSTTPTPQANEAVASPTSFAFNPTLQDVGISDPSGPESSSHAALWGIEEEPLHDFENDYWESTPSLKEIFQRFLHTRFPSYAASTSPESIVHRNTSHSHNIATTSTPHSLRRAALIRQHHPLTSRASTAQHRRRRSWLRRGSSCASESARRSTVARSSLGTSTNRNYWDLGGSSIAGSGAGGWGEV